ncbi:PREDICTED: nicotinamide riboside kinase 1-like [Cyprinodon variegatus]|uniref:Nicotinamide riboside kinase 1 n=1 Tax=Cyprinodon variegatus TaxID=28743 RepID=A0A3Q2DDP1_CYPVA|nr:PREDICTED: nicotinamide riboside kinase 1-like [Cyprinodon variegatus]
MSSSLRQVCSKLSQMKTLVVGVGGITNGGKSTLAKFLHQKIHNSCIIAQDSYFKDDRLVPVDRNGFKQYDTLDALHMDKMMIEVYSWRRDPHSFLKKRGLIPIDSSVDDEVYVLIVEGFLIFNYRPLNELFDKRYFLEIPYEACKKRRSSRVYSPPDPPGYFDGYVWPMYLRNRREMEEITSEIVYLDGLKPKEEVLGVVYEDICQARNRLQGQN